MGGCFSILTAWCFPSKYVVIEDVKPKPHQTITTEEFVPAVQTPYIHVTCAGCGRAFVRNQEDTWKMYCSSNCRKNEQQQKTKENCQRCGKSFTRYIGDTWRVCCSKECSDLLLITKTCQKCGGNFETTGAKKWKKFCSRSSCVPKFSSHSDGDAKKPYSDKSIVWLEKIAQAKKINIRHAENGGEFIIRRDLDNEGRGGYIRVDGFCADTNTVYEFYGDYWHGNPTLFGSEDVNPDTGCTFGELYRRTLEREDFIRSRGYNLITIWENIFDAC